MAGRIVTSTINDDTGILATQNGMNGIAKAWCSWTGSTGAIQASFNISSVTRTSGGTFNLAFTVAMPNTNYAMAVGSCQTVGVGNLGVISYNVAAGAGYKTTTGVQVFNTSGPGTNDVPQNTLVIYSA
jgi:hypothetical protein